MSDCPYRKALLCCADTDGLYLGECQIDCKRMDELEIERDAARAEADKLRGVIGALRAYIQERFDKVECVEWEHGSMNGYMRSARLHENRMVKDELDLLDANPPEVVRGHTGAYDTHTGDTEVCVHFDLDCLEDVDKLPKGWEDEAPVLIIKLPKETP